MGAVTTKQSTKNSRIQLQALSDKKTKSVVKYIPGRISKPFSVIVQNIRM